MIRVWPTVLSIIVLGLATAPAAFADRVFDVRGAGGRPRAGRRARALARRPGIPRRRLLLVDRHETYDHVDPLSAVPPRNAFVRTVVPFLSRAERARITEA